MKKMYVLVRDDLGESYKFVQGFHALAQWMIDFPDVWKNSTIVVLEAKDEDEIINISKKLRKENIDYSMFFEPDLGNEITSIATYSNGRIFSKMNLA